MAKAPRIQIDDLKVNLRQMPAFAERISSSHEGEAGAFHLDSDMGG